MWTSERVEFVDDGRKKVSEVEEVVELAACCVTVKRRDQRRR